MTDTKNTAPADDDELPEPDPIPVFEDAPKTKPQFMRIGDHLYVQSDAGELKIPIRFKTAKMRSMPDLTPVEQIFWLNAEDKKLVRQLDDLYYDEVRIICSKWSQANFEFTQARLGESVRSSRS